MQFKHKHLIVVNTLSLLIAPNTFADINALSKCTIEATQAICTTQMTTPRYQISHHSRCRVQTSPSGYSYLDCKPNETHLFDAIDLQSLQAVDTELIATHNGQALQVSNFVYDKGGVRTIIDYVPIGNLTLPHPKQSRQIKEMLYQRTKSNRVTILLFVLMISSSISTLLMACHQYRLKSR
ncbi:hypothetical protein VIAG107301_00280 [Vibrio agarivorans]